MPFKGGWDGSVVDKVEVMFFVIPLWNDDEYILTMYQRC